MKFRTSFALVSIALACPAWAKDKPSPATSITQPSKICQNFYTAVTKDVVSIFHNKKLGEDKKSAALAAIFQNAVDTDWIGRFVLGQYWSLATPEDQKEYLALYRPYLTMIYISKLHGADTETFNLDDIKLVSIVPQDNQFLAKTLISSQGEPNIRVEYLLAEKANQCQVHDIRIEGISLLSSHSSEFHELATAHGIRGIIDAMKKRLAAADS